MNFPPLSELGVSNFEIAPPSNLQATLKQRHPLSSPDEMNRKSETQCQHCFKSRADGVTLFKCSGCKVDKYCSKECQKLAWPRHRPTCKELQAAMAKSSVIDAMNAMRPLRAFCAKHRPTLCEAAAHALEVDKNPANALLNAFFVDLHPRQGAVRAEQAYYATGAAVVSFITLAHAAPELTQAMMQKLSQDGPHQRALGMKAAYFVILNVVDQGIANIMPVGWPGGLSNNIGPSWKVWMAKLLNEGIVS